MRRLCGLAAFALLPIALAHEADASALKTADDWYDCAAFYTTAMGVAGLAKDRTMVLQFAVLRATAVVKGDELARGSRAVPSPDALRQVFKQMKLERLELFMQKHNEKLLRSKEEREAWNRQYNKRCHGPVAAVHRRIKRKANK